MSAYRRIDKQHHRIQKYKLGRQKNKALKEMGVAATPKTIEQLVESTATATELSAKASSRNVRRWPTKAKAKAKVGAAVAARRHWEASQDETLASEEAARQAYEEREQQKELKRKRRCELTAKCNKRTKRGQPILGLQVERYLCTLRQAGH